MDNTSVNKLTVEQQDEIYESLHKTFSDFPTFPLIAHQLKQAIIDTDGVSINRHNTKKIAEKYFNRKEFNTEESIVTFKKIQLIFKSAYVLVLYARELAKQEANPSQNSVDDIIWTRDTFLAEYSEFREIPEPELGLLFNFRNMTKVATLFIDPRLAKQQILNIAGRLEGSQCAYITGGGQRDEVTNRVLIYEREGGVRAEPRPERAFNRIKPKKKKSAELVRARKRKLNVISHFSSSGSISDSETAEQNASVSKPHIIPESLVSSVVLKSAKARRALPSRLDPPPAHHVHSLKDETDVGAVASTPDWSCATKIVQRWELPREENFLRALLQGDVLDDPVDDMC